MTRGGTSGCHSIFADSDTSSCFGTTKRNWMSYFGNDSATTRHMGEPKSATGREWFYDSVEGLGDWVRMLPFVQLRDAWWELLHMNELLCIVDGCSPSVLCQRSPFMKWSYQMRGDGVEIYVFISDCQYSALWKQWSITQTTPKPLQWGIVYSIHFA